MAFQETPVLPSHAWIIGVVAVSSDRTRARAREAHSISGAPTPRHNDQLAAAAATYPFEPLPFGVSDLGECECPDLCCIDHEHE